jgi:hypothetical protein
MTIFLTESEELVAHKVANLGEGLQSIEPGCDELASRADQNRLSGWI